MNILLIIAVGLFVYAIYIKATEEKAPTQQHREDNVIKGYKIHVTPDIRTRLKVLKMRGRSFKTREEAENLTFEMHEAIPVAETKSWKELGLNYEEIEPGDVWTDIGSMEGEKLESYYRYLEKFREIVENESLKPPEKVKLIRKIPASSGFLRKLKKKYGSHFPKNTLISELTNIDGVSESIAVQLFDKGIYDKEDLKKLNDKELLKIKGVGSTRLVKIKSQLP